MTRLIVFSDLDGTLLDHETYDFSAARPAIEQIKAMGGLVVLASSKTASEMSPLHSILGLGPAPMIVENGAAVVTADRAGSNDADYRAIRALLQSLNAPFRGFGDMTVRDVCDVTGLDEAAARRAKARQFSEPGIWQGDPALRSAFIATLSRNGIKARSGGRFLTLSFGNTKADQMAKIVERFGPAFTVALGDAPNDFEMIASADIGVVIRNDKGPAMPEFSSGTRVIHTTQEGPEGWNAAMTEILSDLQRQKIITPQEGTALNG